MADRASTSVCSSPPPIRVVTGTLPEERHEWTFSSAFKIGRADDCEVQIQNEYVSRRQVEVFFQHGGWFARDLGSSNGLYVDGARVPGVAIAGSTTIQLGVAGPLVTLEVELPKAASVPASAADPAPASTQLYAARYFGKPAAGESVGAHTMMVRRAFHQVQKKQTRKYHLMLGALALVAVGIAGYAYYQHVHIAQQTATAKELFYAIKSLQLDIANVEQMVRESQNQKGLEQVQKYQARQKEMERSYDRFLTSLRVYDPKMPEDQKLILRVARIFGECELDVPPGFMAEVKTYIQKWQSSQRLAKAIRLAQEKGYTRRIATELLNQNLPPQFFYLALQESDFDPFISGPPTYKGIAKGMWQFIPETAVKYGLRIGPLAEFRRPDPMDDRHNWEKETLAAARYLKDIYSTDAQASGLLVIASYNWGEQKVIPIIRSMPANPRERNFWRLITEYRDKVPKETYDYVYYIVSAAVIGENPRLFGFSFDNPLAQLETQ